jgi:hypothetical protein
VIHYHPSIRNDCRRADHPAATVSDVPSEVTCPYCRQAIKNHTLATDETLKSAPAVKPLAKRD